MTLVVGVTGGIGSGKSFVTERLEALEIDVVDADVISRKIVEPGETALKEITNHFGKDILLSDGNLDRRKLRNIIFREEKEKIWLEALTHPLIEKEITEQIYSASSEYIILSSALLLESQQSNLVDVIVVVDAPKSQQITRTISRDKSTEYLVKKIIKSQFSRKERLSKADIILDNSNSKKSLDAKIIELHKELLIRAKHHNIKKF